MALSANTLQQPEFHPLYHPIPSLVPSKLALSLAPAGESFLVSEPEEIEEEEVEFQDGPELERIIERLDRMMVGKALGAGLSSCFRRCGNAGGGADRKSATTMTPAAAESSVSSGISNTAEIMKLELMAEMSALKSSLLSEIAKSRARENDLRSDLAKSRAQLDQMNSKLTTFESRGCQTATSPTKATRTNMLANANRLKAKIVQRAVLPKTKEKPPLSSSCNLRNLAREQVKRNVSERCPTFMKEVRAKNPRGLFQWENALHWLDRHPTIVESLGLSMHNLRQT